MPNISETKVESLLVELKREDVKIAVIEAARKAIQGHHTHAEIDELYEPQLVDDKYGGYRVYFRKAEPKRPTVVAM